MMKEDPSLNHSSTVATYGVAASAPDDSLVGDVLKLYNNALLDVLPEMD